MTAYDRLAANLSEALAISERVDALMDILGPQLPADERDEVAAELVDLRLRLSGVAT